MEPSGGTDIMENFEYVVSLREMTGMVGRSGSPKLCAGDWTLMVVGSAVPLSWMAGGVSAGMVNQNTGSRREQTARLGRRVPGQKDIRISYKKVPSRALQNEVDACVMTPKHV